MLKPAILYAEQVQNLYKTTWFDPKYRYYNYNTYWQSFMVEDKTRDWHEFVSVGADGEIMGYISYFIERDTLNCRHFGIINFTDNPLFGRDVLQAVKDIFERFNFHKLSFGVVIGNPIEPTYDKLCAKYGGRMLCIEKEETKLEDNKYYDVKRYEIMREDYLRAKENKK